MQGMLLADSLFWNPVSLVVAIAIISDEDHATSVLKDWNDIVCILPKAGLDLKPPLCLHHNSRFCSLRNFEPYCASSIKSERRDSNMSMVLCAK